MKKQDPELSMDIRPEEVPEAFTDLDRELAALAEEVPEMPADFHARWMNAVRAEATAKDNLVELRWAGVREAEEDQDASAEERNEPRESSAAEAFENEPETADAETAGETNPPAVEAAEPVQAKGRMISLWHSGRRSLGIAAMFVILLGGVLLTRNSWQPAPQMSLEAKTQQAREKEGPAVTEMPDTAGSDEMALLDMASDEAEVPEEADFEEAEFDEAEAFDEAGAFDEVAAAGIMATAAPTLSVVYTSMPESSMLLTGNALPAQSAEEAEEESVEEAEAAERAVDEDMGAGFMALEGAIANTTVIPMEDAVVNAVALEDAAEMSEEAPVPISDAADQDVAEPEAAVNLPETKMNIGQFLLTALPWIAGAAAVTGLAALALRKDEKKYSLPEEETSPKAKDE